MRYCPTCKAEYRDKVTVCADDGTLLVDKPPAAARNGMDYATLATIATFDERFEAEELAESLLDEGFDVALVSNKGPTVGPLTSPAPALFSIVVPESEAARAGALVTEWRAAMASDADGGARAADEEEAAGEAAQQI